MLHISGVKLCNEVFWKYLTANISAVWIVQALTKNFSVCPTGGTQPKLTPDSPELRDIPEHLWATGIHDVGEVLKLT